MAHFVLEYSDNIAGQELALQTLFKTLHAAAEGCGLFPLKGLRSRAYPCQYYRIADGNPEHAFVHLTVLLGAGRSLEDRRRAAEDFFRLLRDHFAPLSARRGLALSLEMKELEPVLKYNFNTVQNFL